MNKVKLLLIALGMFSGASSFAAVLVTVTSCHWDNQPHPVLVCLDYCYAVSGNTAVMAHPGACLSSAALKATQEQIDPYTQGNCPDYTTQTSVDALNFSETSCKAYVKRLDP